VFEDPRVINALAQRNDAYRVLGLGHTHNTTLLDLVSDFPAKTPSLAGSHIREQIERLVYPLLQLRMERTRNAELEARIASLATDRSMVARKRPRSILKSLALLLVGVLLGLVFGMLVSR